MKKLQILIVEDRRTHRDMLYNEMKKDTEITDYELSMAEDFDTVESIWAPKYQNTPPDIVILDHQLSGGPDGTHVARWMLGRSPSLRIIVNTAFAEEDTCNGKAFEVYANLQREGYNIKFFHKNSDGKTDGIPIWNGVLRPAIMEFIREIRAEDGALSERMQSLCDKFFAYSPSFRKCLASLEKIMRSDSHVLILGETGTGKELLAREIHQNSIREKGPWIAINCTAIPETLVESTLFGHEKGAFTGADKAKQGKFGLAHEGTIFLDEIGDLKLDTQVKLLRTIQERQVMPVGSIKNINVDVRIISATHKNLTKAVAGGTFREDLYYRLNVLSLNVPPLRERREDIIPLSKHFIKKIAKRLNWPDNNRDLSSSAEKVLISNEYGWPGNVRELENFIESTLNNVGPERSQISFTDFPFQTFFQKSGNSLRTSNVKEPKSAKPTNEEDENGATAERTSDSNDKRIIWWRDLDKEKLVALCREIMEKKGITIKNKSGNLLQHVKTFDGHYLHNAMFVLAIFYVAQKEHKVFFSMTDFLTLFGFKEGATFRNWIIGKSKNKDGGKCLPRYKGPNGKEKPYCATELETDGYLIIKEELVRSFFQNFNYS
jgi:DNA-binding NtrC family response regulator